MSLIDLLADEDCWNDFYEYKTSLACPKSFQKELRSFIDSRAYLPVCNTILTDKRFALPKKSVISKLSTGKKRTVYTYPYAENMVLKLLTYLMLRKYDGLYSDNLFSFRPGLSAKDAIRKLRKTRNIASLYSYKVDIHNYFNSVDIPLLLPVLQAAVGDDKPLFEFLKNLLTEPYVIENGKIITEDKGIMAGTPISSFLANLYLRELDAYFADNGIIYARYSDDIILFAPTSTDVRRYAEYIKEFLGMRRLTVNPDKECFSNPSDGWTFLGFLYKGGVIDIAPATVKKLKQKMRRKTNALQRWRKRNDVDGERAAAAFIRIFNRKLLESPVDNELTWSYWFFSVINTTQSLHAIDTYAQDCIRYLISGRHTKSRYKVRYDDIKKLGYKNLVHSYYDFEKEKESEKIKDRRD